MQKTNYFTSDANNTIAYQHDGPRDTATDRTGLFWLGGFMSDMRGSKAEAISGFCQIQNRPFMRMDYSGHGESGGKFADGTISQWLDEAVTAFQQHTAGNRVLVGSSMGGWLTLLLYRYLQETSRKDATRIKGLILIAPAADMTEKLMWDKYDADAKKLFLEKGFNLEPSEYGDEPYLITRELIEDGRRHLLMDDSFAVDCPVRILQGESDEDVPWQHARAQYDMLGGKDVAFTLIKGGDHRLSRQADLVTLLSVCEALCVAGDC